MLSAESTVEAIGLKEVQLKAEAAAGRILENNRLMVQGMLDAVEAEIQPGTPIGPGHFGYHLINTYKVTVTSSVLKTTGKLTAAAQGYWREFGTQGHYRGRKRAQRLRASVRIMTGASSVGAGEKAGLYATHALTKFKVMIREFYGEGQWWRL